MPKRAKLVVIRIITLYEERWVGIKRASMCYTDHLTLKKVISRSPSIILYSFIDSALWHFLIIIDLFAMAHSICKPLADSMVTPIHLALVEHRDFNPSSNGYVQIPVGTGLTAFDF